MPWRERQNGHLSRRPAAFRGFSRRVGSAASIRRSKRVAASRHRAFLGVHRLLWDEGCSTTSTRQAGAFSSSSSSRRITTPTATSCSGCARPCRRTRSPPSISLAKGAAERSCSAPTCRIDVTAIDETNTRVDAERDRRRIADHGGLGLVGLIGVQSNEFPRAVDIARPLREAGVQVMIGGFHVSGCLAMLKEIPGRHQSRAGARHLASSPAKPRRASTRCCTTPPAAS